MWRNVQRWRGVALIGIAVVATIWLAFGNELVLYIHPRYIVFTLIMGVLALAFVIASLLVRTHADDDAAEPRRGAKVLSSVGLAVALVSVAGGMTTIAIARRPATARPTDDSTRPRRPGSA